MTIPAKWGSVKTDILAALAAAPQGKYSRELAAIVDRSDSRTATRLAELRATGRVVAVAEPRHGTTAARMRWFAIEHAGNATTYAKDHGWNFASGTRSRRAPAVKAPAAEMRGPVKFTPAVPFVDKRFVPDRVEPVFSALQVGIYLNTGSAIERAYGGEE